ncbi:hypothetical protein MRB53_010962 [Persea americana]|uniref:Uncharacterized protein n=1 Tax=Persea americana TaxID=3435 RepID=A0ACC2LTL8_PERAE|nr:hypothetical protein MRB53_010962 [Persea americana]
MPKVDSHGARAKVVFVCPPFQWRSRDALQNQYRRQAAFHNAPQLSKYPCTTSDGQCGPTTNLNNDEEVGAHEAVIAALDETIDPNENENENENRSCCERGQFGHCRGNKLRKVISVRNRRTWVLEARAPAQETHFSSWNEEIGCCSG